MIHVYYAEDDEDIAGTVREFLGRRGIRVTVFKGAEAVMEDAKIIGEKAVMTMGPHCAAGSGLSGRSCR